MTDHFRDQRAEAASADVRRAETISGGDYARVGRDVAEHAARGPSVIEEMNATAMRLCKRIAVIGERLRNLGDRAYGEIPTTAQKDDVRPSPPYGGQAAELYYTLNRLDNLITSAERGVNRVDGLA